MPATMTLPYELQQAQSDIERRKMLMQMLAKSALAPEPAIISAGGRTAPNLNALFSPILDAWGYKQEEKKLKEEQDTAAKRTDALLSQGIDTYLQQLKGAPAQEGVGPPTPQGEPAPGLPAMPGDPEAAATQAALYGVRAGLPGFTAFMEKRLEELAKGKITPEQLLKAPNFSASSRKAAAAGGGVNALAPEQKYTTLNNYLLDTTEGQTPRIAGDYADPFGPVGQVPGAASGQLGQKNLRSQKEEWGPRPPSNISVTTNNPRYRGITEAEAKVMQEGRTAALDAVQQLEPIAEAMTLLNRIPAQELGALGNVKAEVGNLAASFGVQLPHTEDVIALRSALGMGVLKRVRALAPVTKEDVKIVERITGSISEPKEALRQILEYAAQSAKRTVQNHNDYVRGVQQAGEKDYQQYGVIPASVEHWYVPFTTEAPRPSGAGEERADPLGLRSPR